MLSKEQQFQIIRSYYEQYGIIRHQIETYNDFVHNLVPIIIQNSEPIQIQKDNIMWEYKIANPVFHPCLTNGSTGQDRIPITPNECRIKNLSYTSDLQVDVIVTETNVETSISNRTIFSVILAKIPILLRSDLCILSRKSKQELFQMKEDPNDPGGYFISRGGEKVIVAQERMASNFPFVLESKNGILNVEMRSTDETEMRASSKCILRYYQYSKKNTVIIEKTFRIIFGKCTKDIPIFILLRALGIETADECINLCRPSEETKEESEKTNELLEPTMEESFFINSQEAALLFIAKAYGMNHFDDMEQVKETIFSTLDEEFLPHEGQSPNDRINKARFLGYMTQKIILVIKGKRPIDDRDHYGNKRVDSTGQLLASIFKMSFAKCLRNFRMVLERNTLSNKSIIIEHELNYNKTPITKDINYALGTGNWTVNRQKITKTGVSQVLRRLSYLDTMSHLRKVVTPNNKNSKLAKPRQLHTTSWGYTDPNETPEGQPCGFVKNISMCCYFSIGTRADIIYELCNENKITGVFTKEYKVFINGKFVGTTDKVEEIRTLFKYYKSQGIPSFDTGILLNPKDKELRITTESGRYCRPVFIVKNGALVCTNEILQSALRTKQPFFTLLREGAIEYIDPLESENTLIAMDIRTVGVDGKPYTHAEIHDTLFMGMTTNCIPFLNHNPSPRITYGCSMQKQSLGLYNSSFQHRTDTNAHMLYYPQKPLVRTEYVDMLKCAEQPAGQVAIVAILCYGGYNVEDSLIVNKTSVERGMFNSIYFKTYRDEELKRSGAYEQVIGPPQGDNIKESDYCLLDKETGIIPVGTRCSNNQILVSKTTFLQQPNSKVVKKDFSLRLTTPEEKIVDGVYTSTNDEGGKLVKIRMRQTRIPVVGDKFASLAAQKGTCGQLVDQEDMPFTLGGITLDLLLNPHF